MATIDFPNPPLTVGQQFTATNGTTYRWDGVVWVLTAAAPSTPGGPAGGDLGAPGSTYPNPTIAPGAVTNAKLASGIDAGKVTVGTLPVAQVPVIGDAKSSDLAYGKLTGAPTSLPPSGSATNDLSGSYPGPTVAKLKGAALGTTTPVTRGDLLVADATPAFKRLPIGTASQVLQTDGVDILWGSSLGGPPSGPATGSLKGSYPAPGIAGLAVGTPELAAGAVTDAKVTDMAATKLTGTVAQARLPVAPSGILTANINDSQITLPKIANGATIAGQPNVVDNAQVKAGNNVWTFMGQLNVTVVPNRPLLTFLRASFHYQQIAGDAGLYGFNIAVYVGGTPNVQDGAIQLNEPFAFTAIAAQWSVMSASYSLTGYYVPTTSTFLYKAFMLNANGTKYDLYKDLFTVTAFQLA